MVRYAQSHTTISPAPRALPRPARAVLYANCGRPVQFARLEHDRLLRSSALDACIAWGGPHTPMDLSAPAMHWLARAQRVAQRDGILLTPPPALAQELHAFADIYCMPRVGRAARRSLIDHLSCETFGSTWARTCQAEPAQSTNVRRCVTWGLEHLQALADDNAWHNLEDNDPESFRAWVAAALLRVQDADAPDWKCHEAGYVWVLRAAERLGLPIAHIPLPIAGQVASDNLTELCAWIRERPIWKALEPAAKLWTQGHAITSDAYVFCLLKEGVSDALFAQLQPHVHAPAPDDRLRLLELLPVYAARGSKSAIAWILSQASQDLTDLPGAQEAWQKAGLLACEAALRAHRSDGALWLLDMLNAAHADGILTEHASKLASHVARHTPEALPTWISLLQAHGAWAEVCYEQLLGSAVKSGQVGAAQSVLAALTPQERHAALMTYGTTAPVRLAVQGGHAAIFELLLQQLEDSQQISNLLMHHARWVWCLAPCRDASAQDAQKQWGGHISVLRAALPYVRQVDAHVLANTWIERWAELCAKLADLDTLHMLLELRPEDAWRDTCVQKLLPVWLACGAGKQGVRAMLDALAPDSAVRLLVNQSVELISAAIEGGDVEMLAWLGTKIEPRAQARRILYTRAFNRGSALFGSAERGHVAMVRFWFCDYLQGALGAEAVSGAARGLLEQAAGNNQPAIFDMVLHPMQHADSLDTIMTRGGATMLAFAIQNGHQAMVDKLLALPTRDATRLAILAGEDDSSEGGNSPLSWAQRLGDLRALEALLAWAPADFRTSMQKQGSLSGIIAACQYGHVKLAHYLLMEGTDAAKGAMFAVHTGKLLLSAARHGDVYLLEEAGRLTRAT